MSKSAIKFKLSVSVIKEGNGYIAYSPALDLSSSGKSAKIARDRFVEAVGIFFDELVKKGTLESVLTDCGWKKTDSVWKPPVVISHDVENFCVAA